MKEIFSRVPFIRALLPLVAGILIAPAIPFPMTRYLIILLFVLVFGMLLNERKKRQHRELLPGMLFFFFFFLCGIITESIQNQYPVVPDGDSFLATLRETPQEKKRSFKAEAHLSLCFTRDSSQRCNEKIILYFSKGEQAAALKPGERIIFHRKPSAIKNQGNPYEFDYKRFAELRGIYRQVYLTKDEWSSAGADSTFNLFIFAETLRERLLDIFIANGITGSSFDLLSALTLGYRKTIDPEINRVFAATGATHVLSVSGLHVGILYLMIRVLIGFLGKRKQTRWLYFVIATSIIWIFALITGFSPPVQRSALMFSMLLIGENLRRPVNIYNMLAASAFIILLIRPNFLYDTGFQLSYAALTGIVYFQPLLDALFSFSWRISRYLWSLLTVSIAAQLATFPVTCFYFNQFPVYFWLSGFVVVPLSFLFLFLGIALLITSPLPLVPVVLAKISIFLVEVMLGCLHAIENLPGSLLQNFSFPLPALIITSAGIISMVLFIETRQKKFLMLLTGLAASGILISSITRVKQNLHKEIIAYSADQPVFHLLYGKKNYLLAPESTLSQEFPEWQIMPVIRYYGLQRPVLVAWEDDFYDAILFKKGNLACFEGVVLRLQPKKDVSGSITAVLVQKSHNTTATRPAEDNIVIVYSRQRQQHKDQEIVHALEQQGALRLRIP
jgi:competence protein ComEC